MTRDAFLQIVIDVVPRIVAACGVHYQVREDVAQDLYLQALQKWYPRYKPIEFNNEVLARSYITKCAIVGVFNTFKSGKYDPTVCYSPCEGDPCEVHSHPRQCRQARALQEFYNNIADSTEPYHEEKEDKDRVRALIQDWPEQRKKIVEMLLDSCTLREITDTMGYAFEGTKGNWSVLWHLRKAIKDLEREREEGNL